MPFDDRKNLAISNVATAPSPATSGTSLVVTAGQGSRFSATPPYNLVVGPANVILTPANAEIVRVTARSTDTLTITRAQEGSSARSIIVGDVIYQGPTDKTFDDIETAIDTGFPLGSGTWSSYTPTWTQSSTVTKTVQYARYMQSGKWTVVEVAMTATGAGTAGSALAVTLPVSVNGSYANGLYVGGTFVWFDSGTAVYTGVACFQTANTVQFRIGGTDSTGAFMGAGGGSSAAVASGDVLSFSVSYEAA